MGAESAREPETAVSGWQVGQDQAELRPAAGDVSAAPQDAFDAQVHHRWALGTCHC